MTPDELREAEAIAERLRTGARKYAELNPAGRALLTRYREHLEKQGFQSYNHYIAAQAATTRPSPNPLRYVSAAGKGLAASVGVNLPEQPGEPTALRSAAELVGTGLAFIPIGRGVSLAARAGAKIVPKALAKATPNVVSVALRLGGAVGGYAGTKETIAQLTSGRPLNPEKILDEAVSNATIAAALPVGGALVGGAAHKLAGAIPGAAKAEVGKTVGAALYAVPGVRQVAQFVRGLTITPSRNFKSISPLFRVDDTLEVFARFDGPATVAGAGHLSNVFMKVAEHLRQEAGSTKNPALRRSALYLAGAARSLERGRRFQNAQTIQAGQQAYNQVMQAGASLPALTKRQVREAALWAKDAAERRVALQVQQAAGGKLGTNGLSNLSPNAISNAVSWLEKAINSPAFKTGKDQLTKEGEYLAFLRDLLILAKPGSRMAEGMARSFISHWRIGMGNVSASLVNLTQLENTAGAEGGEAIAWAIKQMNDNTRLARVIKARVVGQGFGQSLSLGLQFRDKVQQLSMGPFLAAERYMRPVAGLARYYNVVVKGGGKAGDGLKQAVASAREKQFDYAYNMPKLLRNPSVFGSAARIMFQFFPFALNQANFVAGMNLQQYARYVPYHLALAGARGVPFVEATDRIGSALTGVSLLNYYLAHPDFGPYAEGLPGKLGGVALGRRIDWTHDFVERVTEMSPGAFAEWSQTLASGVADLMQDPSAENFRRVLRAIAPTTMQNIDKAIEAENSKAFLTAQGEVLVEKPTAKELGKQVLGLQPQRLAEARALSSYQRQLTMDRRNRAQVYIRALRLSVREGDFERGAKAVEALVNLGYDPQAINRIILGADEPLELRAFRATPDSLKPKIIQILEKRLHKRLTEER